MNIAFILGEFPSYSETFILDQISVLINKGHEVEIYAITSGILKSDREHFNKKDILDKVNYVWPDPKKNILYKIFLSLKLLFCLVKTDFSELKTVISFSDYHKRFGQLYSQLFLLALNKNRFNNYDIIHAHFGQYGTLGVFLKDVYSLRAKVVTTFHGFDLNVIPQKYSHKFYDKLFQRGDCFTVNSAFSYKKLHSLGCPQQKIVRIPVGVELHKFPFHERSLKAGEEIRLLTVARLVEVKGLQYAIKALAKLRNKNLSLKYQIVGDGPLKDDLKKLVKQLALEESVEFLGAQSHEDVLSLFSKAHIFILPSIIAYDGAEETQGLALLEAQASGLPVLSTLVGGIPESVVNGKSGYLVLPKDIDSLTTKLKFLIDHPELWPEMGKNGRAHVEKNFNHKLLSDLLVGTYNNLLNEN
jgi:colanic acid/amylovoran biosynthesis glycosyltransferase